MAVVGGSWLVWNETVSQVFTTGEGNYNVKPVFTIKVAEFNGSYYKVGGKQLEVRDLKVEMITSTFSHWRRLQKS